YEGESASSLIVAAMIILPQVLTALMSPWVGRRARTWGRRPLLLIGFGALPIRALVFALTADPPLLISLQLLDGISGAVIGVLTTSRCKSVDRWSEFEFCGLSTRAISPSMVLSRASGAKGSPRQAGPPTQYSEMLPCDQNSQLSGQRVRF